jgi:hypothetical protein
MYRETAGIKACLLMDYEDFHPAGEGLTMLVRRLLEDPAGTGLERDTAVILLSLFEADGPASPPGRRRESILYYQLPPACRDREKVCRPIEGDLPLI